MEDAESSNLSTGSTYTNRLNTESHNSTYMNPHLEQAITISNQQIRSEFERIWEEVTETQPPDYRILIWGSTIQDKDRTPNDLDVIIEYTGKSIDPEKENSIESWLKTSVRITEFSYVDPLVTHYNETPDIISRSRCSRVYSVDENGWLKF